MHDRAPAIERLGMGSKNSANVMLSNLKKDGVIAYDKTTITATDVWFPYGRPGSDDNED